MALRVEDDEVWKWYCIAMEQNESGCGVLSFCRRYNLNLIKFNNIKFRIFSIQEKQPEAYAKKVELLEKYQASMLTMKKFAAQNGVKPSAISDFQTHLRYKALVERLLKTRERTYLGEPAEQQMSFVALKAPVAQQKAAPPIQTTEIIEAQNDIELRITKGVRVLISPELDGMKVIKIIELLKDL